MTVKPTKPTKTPVKENTNMSRLSYLIENELEKAEVVLAAQSILDKLQGIAKDLSKIEGDDLMPMADSLRLTFGPEIASKFNSVATDEIRSTMEKIQAAKAAISNEVARMEGAVNGEPINDMGMDTGENDLDVPDMESPAPEMGDDVPADDSFDDMAPDMAQDMDMGADTMGSAETASGRMKKESVQLSKNIKVLRESANPSRLIYETFRRTVKETKNSTLAAKAVAKAFAIDYSDVVSIVRESRVEEGKTFNPKDGYNDKNQKLAQRKAKGKAKRQGRDPERDDDDLQEGKTFGFGDDKEKADKFKQRQASGKTKRKGRDPERDDDDDLKEFADPHARYAKQMKKYNIDSFVGDLLPKLGGANNLVEVSAGDLQDGDYFFSKTSGQSYNFSQDGTIATKDNSDASRDGPGGPYIGHFAEYEDFHPTDVSKKPSIYGRYVWCQNNPSLKGQELDGVAPASHVFKIVDIRKVRGLK